MRDRLERRWDTLNGVARTELHARLFAPIEADLEVATTFLERAEYAHLKSGAHAKARVQKECAHARISFDAADTGPFSQPMALMKAMEDVQARLKISVGVFEHLLGDMISLRSECMSASERLRPQYRSLRKRHQEILQDEGSISDTVDRACITVATLTALARSEAAVAQGSEAMWKAGRMVDEANQLANAVENLASEWSSRTHEIKQMNEWMADLKEQILIDRNQIMELSSILERLEEECSDLTGSVVTACHEGIRQLEASWSSTRADLLSRIERLESVKC